MSTATLPAPPRDFRTLTTQVRAAGLLDRRLGYYAAKIAFTLGAFGAGWWAFFAVGRSWATLGVAVLLGIVSTQLGFLGHDAGPRQIFCSGRTDRLLGLLIGNGLIGLSFGWWVPKHNAQHACPNEVGRDPDIGVGLMGASSPNEWRRGAWRLAAWMARRQAELFFPLTLLRSTGLYVSGVQDLVRRRDRAVIVERVILAVHAALYLTAVFWVLAPFEGIAFLVVHQAVFSVHLGCSFAPNHKGMPLIEEGREMSFARRQVVTARNLTGGWWTSFVFGGLNFQIEHHLFPAMSRPNLARAEHLVRAFCTENGLTYCEESAIASFRHAIRHLGLANLDAPSLESRAPAP